MRIWVKPHTAVLARSINSPNGDHPLETSAILTFNFHKKGPLFENWRCFNVKGKPKGMYAVNIAPVKVHLLITQRDIVKDEHLFL